MADETKPLAKVCLRIFEDDYNFIKEMADSAAESSGLARRGTVDSISANRIIRQIINNYVNQIRADARQRVDKLDPVKPTGPTAVDIQL